MDLRLRQLCIAAGDKGSTVDMLKRVFDLRPVHGSGDLSEYGLPARGPMSEAGRALLAQQGVENLLFAIGSDFIEVLFPTKASTVARFIERRGGEGAGYMVILQDDDVSSYADFASAAGVRIIHLAEYPQYADIQYHPKDSGGALLSIGSHIPNNVEGGPWYPAGTAWQERPASERVNAIVGVRLHSQRPEQLAAKWAALLGRRASAASTEWQIIVDGAVLRFSRCSDSPDDQFCGLDLRSDDIVGTLASARDAGLTVSGDSIQWLGLSWNLVP